MKVNARRLVIIVIVVLAGALHVEAQEQWDLWVETAGTAGFGGVNPDGSWSFLYGSDLVAASHVLFVQPAPTCGHASRFCWVYSGGDPSVAINISDATIFVSFGSHWPMPAASVSLHPGNPSQPAPPYSLARWTSPVGGELDLKLLVEDLDTDCAPTGDGVDWWLTHEGVTLMSGSLDDGGATGGLTAREVTVAVGDRIDLVIGPGPLGNHACDTTLVRVTVEFESAVFYDGFESGGTSVWSSTTP